MLSCPTIITALLFIESDYNIFEQTQCVHMHDQKKQTNKQPQTNKQTNKQKFFLEKERESRVSGLGIPKYYTSYKCFQGESVVLHLFNSD